MSQVALQTVLQDFQRAGVTHAVATDPFSFLSDRLLSAGFRQSEPHQPQQGAMKIPCKSVVSETPAEKIMPTQSEFMYKGAENPKLLLIASSEKVSDELFSSEEQDLLERMLTAIQLKMSDVGFLYFTEGAVPDSDVLHKNVSAFSVPVLFIGQGTCDALLQQTVNDINTGQNKIQNQVIQGMMHPKMCLQQPTMKRAVWQSLLILQEALNA